MENRERDLELAQRSLQGDERAMREIYLQHAERVYVLALRLTGNRSDAEDVLQDTFLRAWRSLSRFRGEASLGTWLYRIALNLCRDLSKRRRPVAQPDQDIVLPQAADLIARKRLTTALSQLPPGYREVIILHDVMELEHAEIAAVLKIGVGTSKSQLHKARGQLRRIYIESTSSPTANRGTNGGQR